MTNSIIKKSHILAKDIFKAEKIHNSLKYLDLKIGRKKKTNSIFEGFSNTPQKDLEAWGVYFMFFKKKLIYIGSWCGNYKTITKKIEDGVANERWKKHIITDTTRFQDVTFTSNCEFDKDEIIKLLKNSKETVKLNKKGKATLATAIDLYKNDKVNENKYKNFINKEFDKIKQKIKLKYCSHNSDSTICEDVIAKLDDIKYDDLKSHQAILAGGGKNHSLNRFKFSDEFWNKFKKRDEKNIFDDFEFIYFKFKNFIDYIPKDFLNDGSIKDKDAKEYISKRFRDEFEKPFIKKFSPPANNDDDKSDKEFKIIQDISIIDSIEKYLEDKYNKQNFFIK